MNAFGFTRKRRSCAMGALVVLLGFAGNTHATEVAVDYPGTMADELRMLEETHPLIQAGKHSVIAAEHGVTVARAGFLPKVNLTSVYGNQNTQAAASSGNAVRAHNFTRKVSLTQPLFAGGRNVRGFQSARISRELAELGLETTRQGIFVEGIGAYMNVLRSSKVVQIAQEEEDNIRRQENLEDERVRKGSGISVDVMFAKARLQRAKEQRVAQQGLLNNAISSYFQVFDHGPNISAMRSPSDPNQLVPDSVDEAIEVALANNPSMKSSNLQLELAEKRVGISRASFFPSLDLVAEHNKERDNSGTLGIKREQLVKFDAKFEIFSGFASRAGFQQAQAQLAASKHNRYNTLRRIREGVMVSWQNLETQRARKYFLQNASNRAHEVVEGRRKLRQAGKETTINVLDAENEVKKTERDLAFADFDAKLAVYRLLHSMGELKVDDL